MSVLNPRNAVLNPGQSLFRAAVVLSERSANSRSRTCCWSKNRRMHGKPDFPQPVNIANPHNAKYLRAIHEMGSIGFDWVRIALFLAFEWLLNWLPTAPHSSPLSHICARTASAAQTAVSARSTVGPREAPIQPASVNSLRSASIHPPSGPTSRAVVSPG